ncbi:hypothetical protein Cha6605_2295 [Chamaesiphon minutus PCC 6605]|uniref:Uncharacterized protein n=1 Tax=Chamaesiphon minutus (strain ATCC 27169 / PCC 6605) TaxID=1173020 RepID=K9UE39_CHAP6|nr:hypothetical protein Cha6605_2295 [Chamaesiphon minutus PCC 6605]
MTILIQRYLVPMLACLPLSGRSSQIVMLLTCQASNARQHFETGQTTFKLQSVALGIGIAIAIGLQGTIAAAASGYGTRQRPAPCPKDRTAPTAGPLRLEQAKAHFRCTNEGEVTLAAERSILFLVGDLDMRLANKPRTVRANDIIGYQSGLKGHIEISRESPVYDIKASYRETICHSHGYEPGPSCTTSFHSMSAGLCFRDTMGDWYCRLHRDSWRTKKPVSDTSR